MKCWLHRRLIQPAQEKGVVQGGKMRTDTTMVEAKIHYPTDRGLLHRGGGSNKSFDHG